MNEHRSAEEQRQLDERYMELALEQARAAAAMGEVPIGAVVVYEPIDRGTRRPLAAPQVIAQAHNRRETDRDPAGHAEFLAMKEAARVLDAWRLSDCTVYVTLEPCIMCAGLMHQARIARCVYGAPDQKAGAVGTLYDIHADERLNHQFEATGGVCEEECVALLRDFFHARRKKRPVAAASETAIRGPEAAGVEDVESAESAEHAKNEPDNFGRSEKEAVR